MAQNKNDLFSTLFGVSSSQGKNAIMNNSLDKLNKNIFIEHLSGALGVPKNQISFNVNTGIVTVRDGSHSYKINLAGQNTKSPAYAIFQGEKIINRTLALRGEDSKLGITDLVNGTRRVALDILKNDPRIKGMASIKDKIDEINKTIVGLQKDYRKIEDRWDIATQKAERRSRPSGNILKDTERASTVNYIHQLEKDLSNLGKYWDVVKSQKQGNESWKHFNDRVTGAGGVAQGIVGELLNGTSKANVKKMFPEFGRVIDEIFKDYSFLQGTAAASNRNRSVLAPINEMVSHNIGTKKEHQTSNIATPWYTKLNTGLFKNGIIGIATQKASEIAKANKAILAPGHVRVARVVTNQQIKNAGGGLTDSIRDAHMIMSKMAADEMRYITRDISKQLSVDDILKAKGNKGFNNWNSPEAVRKAIKNALGEDKDFLREMHGMSKAEKKKFYESMGITSQGFGDNPVAFNIRGNYKVDHFKSGSGKMVNVGGTGRSTAIVSNNDKMFQEFSKDGIPVSMLVGEYLEGAKFTSDIIQDQIYKMLYFGQTGGKPLQEYKGADLSKVLNSAISRNKNFQFLKDMGFKFKVDDNGNLIYNMSTQDIEQGAEKLYAKNPKNTIQYYQDNILKTFYQFLGKFNKNLKVVEEDGTWYLEDAMRDYQFVQYNPADVGAPNYGNASSGGFEGQRNTVANAAKFGKNFQTGIMQQFNSKGNALGARREAFAKTRQMLKTNARLSAGTHGTEINVNDLLKDFDPNNIPKKQYVGDKLLASSFDQTTMGIILNKVASGELDLSKGGFINAKWIDADGNQRMGIPIEPITKGEAEKLLSSAYEMSDTQGNKFKVYGSGAIDQKYDIFNEAFSLSHLMKGGANSSSHDQENLGDKVLQYMEDRSFSLYDNSGSEAEKYGKSDTINSMRGVAHAVNSAVDAYTANTIWLSKSSLKRMLSRREGKNAGADHGLSDAEAQAILSTWNKTHADRQLDYKAWKAQHKDQKNNFIQDFLYDTITKDEKNGVYSDLLVGALNRDPTIGEDATKWARIRYSGAYTGKDIGVSDDLAWLVSGDFDGDTVRAALLSLGLDNGDASSIAKRYEEARTAQASQNTWGKVVSKWLDTKVADDKKLFTSDDARLSNDPQLKQLNRDYTTFAQKSIGNFGNRQFNALKLFSSEGTNLINTSPAEAQLFLAMTEQFYQEAISGKKLLEQAQGKTPEEQRAIFAQGRERLTKINEFLRNPEMYKTAEGRLQILETFQQLVGKDITSQDFFVNDKLRTQALGRVLGTKAGRSALYNSLEIGDRSLFDKIGFLEDKFNIADLNPELMDKLFNSGFFSKDSMANAFGSVVGTLASQGRLEDLVYNNELDTNYRAKAQNADISTEFKELSSSNKELISAINKLTNAIEGKTGGGAGGGGPRQLTPYEAAQKLKLGEGAYPLSISRVTSAINPYGGQDDTAFLHNLLNNSGQKRFGYGTISKLKQAAGGRPFASRLGNTSGSMAELMALLGTNTWAETLKVAGENGINLTGDALMYYQDVFKNRDELQKVADAYYGKSGINQKNYDFDKYYNENVIKVAERQKNQLLDYFKETGFQITGGVLPEAMVAGVLNGRTVTSRTDIGFKGKYTNNFGEQREGLVFADLKNKDTGPLSLNDTMQAAFTNNAMRTVLSALRYGRIEEAQGLVDTYNSQMQKLGFDTKFTLADLEKQFKNSKGEWLDEQDLKNIVIKGTGKNSQIYKLNDNKEAIGIAMEYMGKVLAGGDLTNEEKSFILNLMSLSTDTGSILGGAGGGAGSGGSGGKGRRGTGTSARTSKLTEYKGYAAKYAKYIRDIAQMEGNMSKMSPDQRAMYQEYLQDLYTQRDAAQNKLKPLYDSLSKEDVKLAEEYNAQLDNTIKKVYAQQGAGAQAQKKSLFGQLADGIKTSMQRMFSFGMIGYRIVGKISQAFQKVIGYAQQLDQAMVNIQIVTGKTREEAFNLMDSYNKLAKQLGSTTTEVANSANVWLRQGYSVNKVNELITSSLYLSKLGMLDTATAAKDLTGIIKGFKLEVSEATNVVSKLTMIDQNAAVSAGNIATAMQQVSASAQQAGLDIDTTMGYISTIADVSQRDPSSVGASLRTIISRYGTVKAGAFSGMGIDNTGDDLENINDIEKVLRRLGISIRTSTMEFRALDEVLGEIADKWMEYSSVERNAIATAFAGTRQRESFLILMSNFDKARELTQVAAESQGMAELKYQAYMESSEAATKRLQNAWEGLTNSFRTSNVLTGIRKTIAWIVENLTTVASTLGSILLSLKAMRSVNLSNLTGRGLSGGIGSSIRNRTVGLFNNIKGYAEGNETTRFFNTVTSSLKDLVATAHRIAGDNVTGAVTSGSSNFNSGYEKIDGKWYYKDRDRKGNIVKRQIRGHAADVLEYNELKRIVGSGSNYSTNNKEAYFDEEKGAWFYSKTGNRITSKARLEELEGQRNKYQEASGKLLKYQKLERKGGSLGHRFKMGATAGLMTGVMQGLSYGATFKNRDGGEASTGAKAVAGATMGLTTAVTTGLMTAIPYIGPVVGPTLGPIIGTFIGNTIAPALGNIIDQQAISRRERSKEAEKSYSAIKAIQNDTNTLKELSTEGSLSFDQYQKAKTSVNSMITQLYGNTKAGRILLNQYDPNNPANENLSDLEVIDRIKLLFNNYLSGDTSVLTQWEKALYQAEVETFKASKENELYTNKEILNNAYVKHAYGGGIKTALRDFMKLNPTLFDEDALREGKLYFKGTTNERLDTERKLFEYLGDQGYDTTAFYKQLQKNIADLSSAVNNIDSTVGEINEKQVAASAIDKGIGDLTTAQIKRMGIDEIARKILEDVNERGGFYEGNGDIQYRYQWTGSLESLGGVAKDYISDYIKNNATLYGILTGQSYTLGEVSKGALTGKKADEYKLSFARQLNLTVEELDANLEKYSSFSLGDIMKGYEDVKSALENLDSLFNSIVSSTGMTADNFEAILSKFPSLIGEANDIGSLVAAIFNQTDTYIDIQRKNLIEDLGSNTSFFTEWKLSLSEDLRELMKDTALDNVDSGASFWKAYLTLSEGDKEKFAEVAESFKKQFNSITADVSIDTAILDKYRSYISKVYEMQIKNLQDQKSALEKINSQREYENKLVEARLKLENAQNEKQMVYREGVGFVYEADQEAIQQAQEELDKLENEKIVDSLDMIITEMQSQKDWLDKLPERMEFQKLTEAFGEKSPLAEILGTKNSGIWGSVNTLIEMYQKTHEFSSQGFTAEQEAILESDKAETKAKLQQYNNEYEAYERINEALNQYRAGKLSQADLSEAIAQEAINKNNSVNVRTYAKNLWNSLENADYNVPTIMEAVHNTQAQAQTAFTNANIAANRMQNEFKVTNEMTGKYSSHTKDAEGNWILNSVFDKLGTDRSLNGRTLLGANEKDWAREKAKSEIIDAFANGPGKFMRFSANGQDWLLQTVDQNQSWISNYRDVLWDFFGNQKYYVDVPALKEVFGDKMNDAIGQPHYMDRDANSRNGGAVDFYRTFYEDTGVFNNLSTAQQQYLRSLYKNIAPGTPFEKASALNSVKLRDRIGYWDLMTLIDSIFADSSVVPIATDVSQLSKEANARGSLSTRGGLSTISELGPELFATPGLSGTALIPEGSKVLPADATKGLWEFGSFASEFIKPLRSLMSGFGNGDAVGFGTDESTNINTLNITLRADKDFDADKFIQQLKLLQAISKNNA